MSGLSRLASRIRAGGSGGLLVHFISFAALASVAFHMNRLALLRLDDGNYIRILMDQRFVWDLPTLGFSSEMLQSLGNIEHHVNPYLIPELLLPALLGGWKVHPAQTYTLLAATMFLAVYLVSRTLGFRTGGGRGIARGTARAGIQHTHRRGARRVATVHLQRGYVTARIAVRI